MCSIPDLLAHFRRLWRMLPLPPRASPRSRVSVYGLHDARTLASTSMATLLGPHVPSRYGRLVLLCHKFRYLFRAAQHGQRDSIVARAATNLRRIVAIEFGTWRSGRNGGSSGLVTFAYGKLREHPRGTIR